jgi:hypothetical protein
MKGEAVGMRESGEICDWTCAIVIIDRALSEPMDSIFITVDQAGFPANRGCLLLICDFRSENDEVMQLSVFGNVTH